MSFPQWIVPVASAAAVLVALGTAWFAHVRWRRDRRPKLLVRLVREPHIEGDSHPYTGFAKLWVEVYNDGGAAAEQVLAESMDVDFSKHNSDLPTAIRFKGAFLKPGESGSVLLGRDRHVRLPHPGLQPFTMKARCRGFGCRWRVRLDPRDVLP